MFSKLKKQVKVIKSKMQGDEKPKVKTFSLTKEESIETKLANNWVIKKKLELEELHNIVDAMDFKFNAWVAQLIRRKGIQPHPNQTVDFDYKKNTMTITMPPIPEQGPSTQGATSPGMMPPIGQEFQDKIKKIQEGNGQTEK